MPMDLKNMAIKPKDDVLYDYEGRRPNYGYGLSIHLNDSQIKALGLDSPMKAGTIVMVEAKAIVESTRESVEGNVVNEDGDQTDMSMSLQITDLAVEEEGEAPNAAEILYSKPKPKEQSS